MASLRSMKHFEAVEFEDKVHSMKTAKIKQRGSGLKDLLKGTLAKTNGGSFQEDMQMKSTVSYPRYELLDMPKEIKTYTKSLQGMKETCNFKKDKFKEYTKKWLNQEHNNDDDDYDIPISPSPPMREMTPVDNLN